MKFILMLLVFFLSMKAGEESPDTGTDTGTIGSLDEVATDDTGEDSARSDTTEKDGKPAETQQELILGKYKTPEDLIVAHQELERKMHEVAMENSTLKKPADPEPYEWVELSDEQLETLQETDPEAHKWYLAEKDSRRIEEIVNKRLKPLEDKAKPIDELQKKELANQFYTQETSVEAQTKSLFGEEFESLDKQRQDAGFLQKVFQHIPKPLADAILDHHKNGSPEYARQLLLGQIQVYNLRQGAQKRSMSVNPDIGSPSGRPRQTDKAASLEEAGMLAAQELGIK